MTEADAIDVVDLFQESLLDAMTAENGVLDSSRKGGMSLAKQVSFYITLINVVLNSFHLR